MSTTKHASGWISPAASASLAAQTAANLILIGLWLWLYHPLYPYLTTIFSREDFRTNQLVLLGVVILIALQVRSGHLRPRLTAAPQLYRPALLLTLGSGLLFLLAERFLNINTISASLFAVGSYGLLGLWLPPHRWRQGVPAALLLAGALPFGDHLQTFVGYPLRILTAELVGSGLAQAGIASIGVDTILVFENGVSQIDLPCSGVKSLWTGGLFLLAATWLERRRLGGCWLLLAMTFAGLLFAANLARVAILISVGEVAGWRLAAKMLHVPLGVLGFAAACAAAVLLLRAWVPACPPVDAPASTLPRPGWLAPALGLALTALILLYAPRPQTGLAQPPQSWRFPAGLSVTPLPLKPDEQEWFTRDGAESAERYRFEWRGLSGSMILVTSRTWRAHHRPERCFEVYGLSLEESRPHLAETNFPLRLVSLGDGEAHRLYSAAYWFQSPTRTTDDYATRIWADLSPQRQRWVLVSILFDDVHSATQPEVQSLYIALHAAVAQNLAK
ncbi:MAG: hypothetical protein Kow0031_16580 [Anaerolineae bacterium]